jgi:RNA polymerase-binding transcription factor DksA
MLNTGEMGVALLVGRAVGCLVDVLRVTAGQPGWGAFAGGLMRRSLLEDRRMSASLNPDEISTYRDTLQSMRARLRGDLDQMTDEALSRNGPEGSGNLSHLPLHMADLGTDSFDQEFTLGLIENEQATLEQILAALGRIEKGTFGKCAECGETIAKPRLQALPYTPHCIECARKMEQG